MQTYETELAKDYFAEQLKSDTVEQMFKRKLTHVNLEPERVVFMDEPKKEKKARALSESGKSVRNLIYWLFRLQNYNLNGLSSLRFNRAYIAKYKWATKAVFTGTDAAKNPTLRSVANHMRALNLEEKLIIPNVTDQENPRLVVLLKSNLLTEEEKKDISSLFDIKVKRKSKRGTTTKYRLELYKWALDHYNDKDYLDSGKASLSLLKRIRTAIINYEKGLYVDDKPLLRKLYSERTGKNTEVTAEFVQKIKDKKTETKKIHYYALIIGDKIKEFAEENLDYIRGYSSAMKDSNPNAKLIRFEYVN